ncbi:MAG: hypothetical protein IJF38_01790 [Clostridia bacterium]|nr:hypothetical protein [Clostridia bacterium]
MDKRFFGIRIGTYLAALGSIALAVVVWVIVKMLPSDPDAVFSVIKALGSR